METFKAMKAAFSKARSLVPTSATTSALNETRVPRLNYRFSPRPLLLAEPPSEAQADSRLGPALAAHNPCSGSASNGPDTVQQTARAGNQRRSDDHRFQREFPREPMCDQCYLHLSHQ
jgi:hypothetical protein